MRTPIAHVATLLAGITIPSAALAADQSPGLVIIAPDEFINALGPYANERNTDIPTRLIPLKIALLQAADIPITPGQPFPPAADDAELLKRFLFNEWREKHVAFALLVGDADVMPVRYMCLDRVTAPAFDYAFYPSDLYYADVAKADGSFEDWNAQRQGFHAQYFGEVRGEKNKTDPINFDDIDYKPEIAVGRWPVSTSDQAAAVAAKILRHLASIPPDLQARRPGAALIACGGWIENRSAMDTFATTLAGNNWNVEKRYFADSSRDDHTPAPDADNVIALANAGCDVIIHSGHGSDDSWADSISVTSIPKIKGWHADGRPSGHLPVMMSVGCSTARFATLPPYEAYVDISGAAHAGTNNGEVFTQPPPPPACYQTGEYNLTGLGEKSLRALTSGAVAYIGCNTGSQPCGMTLAEGFINALPAGVASARLGECWNQALRHYFDVEHLAALVPVDGNWYPPSIFFQGMKFMLYGDPSLSIAR
ncbi:MAG TPA: C25 family cysteine peptidase [Phycisphaerales bacterium]|nr:C25 family cysteine peptidase [Phycisphaerales bacterium]